MKEPENEPCASAPLQGEPCPSAGTAPPPTPPAGKRTEAQNEHIRHSPSISQPSKSLTQTSNGEARKQTGQNPNKT
jgi:hypothetical protein